jgi:hypothetical protein
MILARFALYVGILLFAVGKLQPVSWRGLGDERAARATVPDPHQESTRAWVPYRRVWLAGGRGLLRISLVLIGAGGGALIVAWLAHVLAR